jgi:hypothetical protein
VYRWLKNQSKIAIRDKVRERDKIRTQAAVRAFEGYSRVCVYE